MTVESFEQWAVLELMGHVRLGGKVSEEEHFGTKLGRIDVPLADGKFITQYFNGSSIYRLTPVSEDVARAVAIRSQPEPVHAWEMPRLPASSQVEQGRDDRDEDGFMGISSDDTRGLAY